MTIKEFNTLDSTLAKEELIKCCGSTKWATKLLDCRPIASIEDLITASDTVWFDCSSADWKEAFTHHPKIGDVDSLKKKFVTKEWATNEQSGVNAADEKTLVDLAAGNEAYENKFGYIFIVCATGKSAEEMLTLLNKRISNSSEDEIKIAMKEQNKITHLRIQKLFS